MREKIFFVICPRCGDIVEVYDNKFGTAKCAECAVEFEVVTAKSYTPNSKEKED